MKLIISLLSLFFCAGAFSQKQPLPLIAKVYSLDKAGSVSDGEGTTKFIFNGSGSILAEHMITAITLFKGKATTYSNKFPLERFFIIKNGPVKITLRDSFAILDRGSVICVLPGDNIRIENAGPTDAQFYEMTYRSIKLPDAERGKKAGGSFMINWEDIFFKPTDKGGTRQFFDRQTTMFNRFDIHVTQLNEGFKSHDPHTHVNEEIILMLDGNAEMQIGTDHQKANAGDVVLLNSMVLHNLTNVGKTPCLYFAIQWN